jgi:hypothetical protein
VGGGGRVLGKISPSDFPHGEANFQTGFPYKKIHKRMSQNSFFVKIKSGFTFFINFNFFRVKIASKDCLNNLLF